jgi:hypothetical protein
MLIVKTICLFNLEYFYIFHKKSTKYLYLVLFIKIGKFELVPS